MSGARFGYRWMVSPDGGEAKWVKQDEVATRYAAWTDCDDMSDAEVMKLRERRWFGARNDKQLQLAA